MFKKYFKRFLTLLALCVLVYIIINMHIRYKAAPFIKTSLNEVKPTYTCIVLGAHVSEDGTPSYVLEDRLNAAFELYKNKKIKRFLLTGDHGRKTYDEVNSMKKYLENKGVLRTDIFLDHAGFDTYNSMVRAKEIFEVTDAIIVTQRFHLSRALYIARKKGINAIGYQAPMSLTKPLPYLIFRETIACTKAYFEVLINRKPHFGGPKIPITGNSALSFDKD